MCIRDRHNNEALWNGQFGGRMVHVPNTAPKAVLSFVRAKGNDKVFAVFNFSKEPKTVSFEEPLYLGKYTDAFSKQLIEFTETTELTIPAWGFRVFVK